MKKSINNLARNYNGEKIVLFGASNGGRYFLKEYETSNVLCFCDNDPKKYEGETFCGFDVISPDSLKDIKEPIYIIIVSSYVKEIYLQLNRLGFSDKVDCFIALNSKHLCIMNNEEIEKVYSLLNNEESKRVYKTVIEKWRNFTETTDFLDVMAEEPIYFNSLTNCSESEVFVDAGAVGSSSFDFMKWTGNKFEKVYCFEPSKESFDMLAREYEQMSIPKDKYKLFNLGLYSDNKSLEFISHGSSHANQIAKEHHEDENIILIDAVKLDDIINDRVTFIKMDIEGAELSAIKGAEGIIKKYKPKLAICLYHNINDFWEIPAEINRICPEYKLYVLHHASSFLDTVLYAQV